jgi:hypothetical protein
MTNPVERLQLHALGSADGTTVNGATASRDRPQIEAATGDFIEALDEYNRSLNGRIPSAGTGDAGEDVVSRGAAYAAVEASRMLRDAGADDCARRVDIAWAAVLAGDIDDIRQHVALEDSARS